MAAPIIGTLIGERWRVTDLLGQGGFGQVFACHDESDIALGQAAVKLLHANTTPAERSEFLGEVKQMATLRHQNLVGYLDSGLHRLGDDVHPFLVTERCLRSLADHLSNQSPAGGSSGDDRSAPLDPAEAVAVLDDILAGLTHLHDRNLVHRDLKPANVLWGDGAWKLADFGLMRQLTATGSYHKGDQVVGTPRFMAPELFTTGRATAATDVYAIGAMAHLLRTGATVHTGSGQALVHAITSTPPVIDPSIGPAWARWIASALAIEPAERPTVAQLRAGLGDLAAPGPAPAMGPAPQPPADRPTLVVDDSSGRSWPPPVEPTTGPGPLTSPPPPPPPFGPPPGVPASTGASSTSSSPTGPLLLAGLAAVGLVVVAALGWRALTGGENEPEITAVATDQPVDDDATTDADTPTEDDQGLEGAEDRDGVQIGEGVEIGDGVEIVGSDDSADDPAADGGDGIDAVSPPEQHVATPPCASGVTDQILITNPDGGHRDYRIHVHHQDAEGVRIDEHVVLLKGVAPGETASAGVTPREAETAGCEVDTFDITPTAAASIEAIDQAEIRECVYDNGWYDVVLDVTNPADRPVDAEVYVAVFGADGIRLDEDWAGTSVYDIGPDETVRADESHVFWNVDALGNPEVTCRVVAVEFG